MAITFVHVAIALGLAAVPNPAGRQAATGEGPFLAAVPVPAAVPAPVAREALLRTETFVDLDANIFLPGKADPAQWMSTGTWARITYDGLQYQYGYDPLTQTYDMKVSGFAESQFGILLQETVGIMAVQLPLFLVSGQIERVEAWFLVTDHNLFPNEGVGITALEDEFTPRSDLNSLEGRLLYEDARGFSGAAYALDHFGAGAHAIDLGAEAVADFEDRMLLDGWFGIGFAADGWDLSGSLGTEVYWRVAGGGGLPESSRPFFRVIYNAPPTAATLTEPVNGQIVGTQRPTLRWTPSIDLNGDAPITYRIKLGSNPLLTEAVSFDVVDATEGTPPLPLAAGAVYWSVESIDPGGATTSSAIGQFTIATGTDAPAAGRSTWIGAHPNPFNPRTEIRCTIVQSDDYRLTIYDQRGRLVRVLRQGRLEAGTHRFVWDGHDDAGQSAASGVYEVLLRSRQTEARTRITLVR